MWSIRRRDPESDERGGDSIVGIQRPVDHSDGLGVHVAGGVVLRRALILERNKTPEDDEIDDPVVGVPACGAARIELGELDVDLRFRIAGYTSLDLVEQRLTGVRLVLTQQTDGFQCECVCIDGEGAHVSTVAGPDIGCNG